jgi:hypothetical protein
MGQIYGFDLSIAIQLTPVAITVSVEQEPKHE